MNTRSPRVALAFTAFALLLVAACGPPPASSPEPSSSSAPGAAGSGGAAPPAAPPPRQAAPTPPPPAVAQVPAGTAIHVELLDALSSGTSTAGQSFRGRLTADVVADGRVVFPTGATVAGTVREAVPLKKFGGQPKLVLALESIDGVAIVASVVEEGKKQAARDAAKIGGGAVAGAIVGHQVDDEKGKLIGAVVGGAIGTAVAAQTGKELELPVGTALAASLEEGVSVTLDR